MLGLKLRKEFQGKRLKGTAIELANDNKTGATQIPAKDFLNITYPSADLLKAIEGIGPGLDRPTVLIGERGLGKSHIMAVLYHALNDFAATREWLQFWATHTGNTKIASIALREGMHIISESLHRQRYKFLWDLIFDKHPEGKWARGMWEGMGDKKTDVPPDTILLEMFKRQPTALILDEYQTWFDGLTDTKQYPWRKWAFNFIQYLAEIADGNPELLLLVVSVRDGRTDAYQQIQRINPMIIDFEGAAQDQGKRDRYKKDRMRLLLHRLFDNRLQVSPSDIKGLINVHVSEFLRLKEISPTEHDQWRDSFTEAWPFSPDLMQLLEDQVLVATYAQETRDLIRILVDLFKCHGEKSPVITAADFLLDDDNSGVAGLLDSVANQQHASLRKKAQRNFTAVIDAIKDEKHVPHLSEIVGALWVRSLAEDNNAGAEPATLQVDITRDKAVDDNAFKVELDKIVENSFNIHHDGNRLVFREEENPQAKLMANARNDKQFGDGSDLIQLAKEIRYVIGGAADIPRAFRIVVLPANWLVSPWSDLNEGDHPEQWDDRIPLIILPDMPDKLNIRIGKWLKEHVQQRRNTLRFLLPRENSTNIYSDRDLLVLSRVALLAASWKTTNPVYGKLLTKYQAELRDIIKVRFDRFAILETWNFTDPNKCEFNVVSHKAQGDKIPEAVDNHIRENMFIPEDFEKLVLDLAGNNETVRKLIKELQEPRPNEETCIPWLGETLVKEKLIRICAQGKIAINLRGMEYLQLRDGEDEDSAWKRMRGRLGTGKHLEETHILLPQAVPQTGGVVTGGTDTTSGGDSGGGDINGGSGETGGQGTGESGGSTGGSGGGDIFGGGGAVKEYNAPATSALNLLGQIEKWEINTGTTIQDMTLKVENLSGAQLNRLIKSLPDGITYELNLIKEED